MKVVAPPYYLVFGNAPQFLEILRFWRRIPIRNMSAVKCSVFQFPTAIRSVFGETIRRIANAKLERIVWAVSQKLHAICIESNIKMAFFVK